MDKHKIFVRGGEETAKVLTLIRKHVGIKGSQTNWPDPKCVFGYSVTHSDGDIGWTDSLDWFAKHGYDEVTPQRFLEAWAPQEVQKSITPEIETIEIKIIL